ncbi:MAG: hypothetical protein Q9160_004617 [Pyrenula sp. 1 TL-2023]
MPSSSARGARTLPYVLFFAGLSYAFDCAIPPIYIDVHTRAVHELSSFQYGSFFGAGTPAQNLSLWPSLEHNETTVVDLNICDGNKDATCGNRTGGLFTKEDSASFKATPQYQSLDSDDFSNVTLGTDTVHLYTHYFESDPAMETTVQGVPVTVLDALPTTNFSAPYSSLALGPKSSLLQSLYNAGKISSRSFGLYIGEASLSSPPSEGSLDSISNIPWTVNGSVTLGGYDATRFKAPVCSFQLQTPSAGSSALQVTITDVRLTIDSQDSDTSLAQADTNKTPTAFDAYISTSSIPITLPSQILDNLKARTADLPPTSNLTLSFIMNTSDGSHPFQTYITPSSLATAIASPSDSSTPFTLGIPFLSSNYLSVDYDTSTFYLAPAVPRASFIGQTTFCPHSTPEPFTEPNGHSFSKQGLIGAVIGGSIGIVAIFSLAYCLIGSWLGRRKEQRLYGSKAKEIEMDAEETQALTEHRFRFWRSR